MTENIVTNENYYLIDDTKFYFYFDDEIDGYVITGPSRDTCIEELYIPNSINGIDIKKVEIYNECLRGFDRIRICDNNRRFAVIDDILFSKNMESLIIYPPEKRNKIYCVPAGVKDIEEEAFFFNQYLKKLFLPTGLERIIQYAMGTYNLETIYIPSTLKKVYFKAFTGCKSLKTVFFQGTAEEWDAIDFTDFNGELTDAEIHFNANIELS